jgi:hypothetical protein
VSGRPPFTTEVTVLDGLSARDRAVLRHWLRREPRGDQPLVLTDDLAQNVLETHSLPLPDEWEEGLIRAIRETQVQTPENQYIIVDLGQCAAGRDRRARAGERGNSLCESLLNSLELPLCRP